MTEYKGCLRSKMFNLSINSSLKFLESFCFSLSFGKSTTSSVLLQSLFWFLFEFLWFFGTSNNWFKYFNWRWSSRCWSSCCCCLCRFYIYLLALGCSPAVIIIKTRIDWETAITWWTIQTLCCSVLWILTVCLFVSYIKCLPLRESAVHFWIQFKLGLWKVEPVNLTSDSK